MVKQIIIDTHEAWEGSGLRVLNEAMTVSRIAMKSTKLFFLLLLAALLAGCVTLPAGEPPEQKVGRTQADEADEADETGPGAPAPLDPDVVFNVLVGEVAIRRQDYPLAFVHLYRAALLSGDAGLAEKAARLAISADGGEGAWDAAELWVSLDPESLQARQVAILYLVNQGRTDQALSHMHEVISIAEKQGEDGFLHVMAALGRSRQQSISVQLMQELASGYPEDPRARYASALLALMAKETETALSEIALLMEAHPESGRSYPLLARVHVARGEKGIARSRLEEGLRSHPSDTAIISTYARLLVDMEEYEEAYRQFSRLLELSPDDPAHLFSLGVIAVQVKRFGEARTHFERLIELDKRSSDAAYYMGRLDQEEGRAGSAESWYRKVTGGDFRLDARLRLAESMIDRGAVEEAREQMNSLRHEDPELSLRLYLVEAEMLAGVWSAERVFSLYEDALEAHPGNAELLYARALYAATVERIDILERDLLQILGEDPDNADALNALGYTLADKTDRLEEAREYITRALALKPGTPAILDSMGWVLYRLGDHEAALAYLREALGKLSDGEIAAHLGEVLWVSGERDEARQVWQDAIELHPESEHLKEVMKRFAD